MTDILIVFPYSTINSLTSIHWFSMSKNLSYSRWSKISTSYSIISCFISLMLLLFIPAVIRGCFLGGLCTCMTVEIFTVKGFDLQITEQGGGLLNHANMLRGSWRTLPGGVERGEPPSKGRELRLRVNDYSSTIHLSLAIHSTPSAINFKKMALGFSG